MAGYKATVGDKTVQVVIDDVSSDECPRSLLTRNPEASDLVQIFHREQSLPGSLGSPSRWPGGLTDVFEILHTQREIDKHAFMSAK